MLFEAIKKDGYTGGYSILTDYVRNWRNGVTPGSGKSAFVPLKFQLGEAFQFDWSEESLMIGGIHRKIQVAHTKLCASRAFYLSAYPTQTQEMLYDAHTKAFTALGGITKRGIPATAPALLYLLHNPHGCGECRYCRSKYLSIQVVRQYENSGRQGDQKEWSCRQCAIFRDDGALFV
jgi:transposase